MAKLIESFEPSPPEPDWVKPLKPSRALIASTAGVNLVLTHIGAHAAYMETVELMDEWFREDELSDGIHVVDFRVVGHSYDTDCGREYDEELIIDDVRLATAEELDAHRSGDWPWDPEEWMTNWPEVRDYRHPGPSDRSVIERILGDRSIGYHTHESSYSEGYVELRFGKPESGGQANLRFKPDGELDHVEVY